MEISNNIFRKMIERKMILQVHIIAIKYKFQYVIFVAKITINANFGT